jgi:Ca2+-transporting ATPase
MRLHTHTHHHHHHHHHHPIKTTTKTKGAGNDYQKDLQFRKLNAVKDVIEIKVVRGGEVKVRARVCARALFVTSSSDGAHGAVAACRLSCTTTALTNLQKHPSPQKPQIINNTDVLVGDVMLIDTGDKIVADGIMVDGHHLVVDEASLTGESDPIKKSPDEDPWCRSGTQVSEGSGRVLVAAVGPQSEWGKTMALVGGAGSEDTPLQEKLADMAGAIGKVGFVVAIASFTALVIKWLVTWCRSPEGCSALKYHLNSGGLVEFFLYGVTIVVVAVPEGLPLAVTIALAYGMKKMMKDNNFVRVLAACETMGGATAICSDKTGTLTENRMTVTEGWFAGAKHATTPDKADLPAELADELLLNFALNSKAHLIPNGDLVTFIGNRTECALLMLARKWGADYAKLREEWEPRVVEVYGFTSARKMASVLVKRDERTLRLYNKGAAEWVLQKCAAVHEGAKVVPMTPAARDKLMETVVAMASRGLRCICLTYADYPVNDPKRAADFFADAARVDDNLTAMAIVGIKDPVRAEVPGAVDVCQKAGITVRMVTGDNIHTARHIARECGILTEGGLALEGPEFRRMPEEELLPKLKDLQVCLFVCFCIHV